MFAKNKHGKSAFQWASDFGEGACAELISDAGGDPIIGPSLPAEITPQHCADLLLTVAQVPCVLAGVAVPAAWAPCWGAEKVSTAAALEWPLLLTDPLPPPCAPFPRCHPIASPRVPRGRAGGGVQGGLRPVRRGPVGRAGRDRARKRHPQHRVPGAGSRSWGLHSKSLEHLCLWCHPDSTFSRLLALFSRALILVGDVRCPTPRSSTCARCDSSLALRLFFAICQHCAQQGL